MENEKGLAVYGTKDFAIGFMLAGVKKVFITEGSPDTEMKSLLADQEANVILLEDEVLEEVSPTRKRLVENSIKPVFVSLSKNMGDEALRSMARRSIGVDLWK